MFEVNEMYSPTEKSLDLCFWLNLFLGFGVFAKMQIPGNIFLCKYEGDMIIEDQFDADVVAGKRREDCYVYTLRIGQTTYW